MRVAVKIIMFFSLLGSVATATALAEERDALELVKVSTPVYRPELSSFEPRFGTYVYETSWQGIPAAELEVKVEPEQLRYRVIAKARTYRAIDLFYRLRYRAEGVISAVDFLPFRTVIDHHENSRYTFTDIRFNKDGSVHTVRFKKGKGTKVKDFNPHNFMLDPFSAAFLARSLRWKEGQSRVFDTYNGDTRYLITLTAKERIKMKVNGEEKNVWVIMPKVVKLTTGKKNKKLRAAWIYVTDDNQRDILQIVSKVFIGSVKTKLVSFTPSSKPRPGTQVAQTRRITFD
ncbi:MAG: DUF3108 domain-containing protein [Candidatus Dadabacteria bacterium]|nr:MAG: DUF3108 domain-containing protein [Candidatus Dadabacteria bacterium]